MSFGVNGVQEVVLLVFLCQGYGQRCYPFALSLVGGPFFIGLGDCAVGATVHKPATHGSAVMGPPRKSSP